MPIRRDALLDLTFINKGGLIGDIKVEGTTDFSDRDGRVQDPERRKPGKKQGHSTGLQENRIFL